MIYLADAFQLKMDEIFEGEIIMIFEEGVFENDDIFIYQLQNVTSILWTLKLSLNMDVNINVMARFKLSS